MSFIGITQESVQEVEKAAESTHGLPMLRLLALFGGLTLVGGVGAELASSEVCALETLSLSGGGGLALSPNHRLWASLGPGSPLASGSVTVRSSTHAMQLGLIPTLYPRTLPGDANRDGVVDAADIVRAMNHFRQPGTLPLAAEGLFNADLDFDLRISSEDLEGIADIITGLR
jgi:hypothetical protein